ncbi:MAG: NUDIX domain-containing protein [Rhodospirillales bacterium]|nr:MAG: NUDIX domain-containing protein [Rhodospirillales bacterium]
MRTIRSARALLIDPADRVLLVKLAGKRIRLDGGGAARPGFWVTPGGSLHDGESFEDALRREIREETGLILGEIGRHVWTGERAIERDGETIDTVAHVFALRVPAFDAAPTALDESERDSFRGLRWWSVDEIAASRDTFVPRGLAGLLRALLTAPWPDTPLRIAA